MGHAAVEGLWAEQIRKDFEWLARWSGSNFPPASHSGWPAWQAILCDKMKWFKTQCRNAAEKAFREALQRGGADCFLRDLLKRVPTDALSAHFKVVSTFWRCLPCGKDFTNKAVATHLFRQHGRVAALRPYVTGTMCRACGVKNAGPPAGFQFML